MLRGIVDVNLATVLSAGIAYPTIIPTTFCSVRNAPVAPAAGLDTAGSIGALLDASVVSACVSRASWSLLRRISSKESFEMLSF